jgi:hypothetical protein
MPGKGLADHARRARALDLAGVAERMRMARPDLPDDPSPEQVEAWIELAELVSDPDSRRRIRAMSERGATDRAPSEPDVDRAAAAGAAPHSDAARRSALSRRRRSSRRARRSAPS